MKDTKTFIVSDTWFNRSIFTEELGVETVVDYNSKLVEKWNSVVGKSDKVYVLGGFGIGSLYEILISLNGNITFLNNSFSDELDTYITKLQNDVETTMDKSLCDRIEFIDKQILTIPELDLVLSYLPLENWYGKTTGTKHMYGYDKDGTVSFDINNDVYKINCMISKWNFEPVKLSTINRLINNSKKL